MMPSPGTHFKQRAGISVSDFYDALNKIWLRQNGVRRGSHKARFAIAVSGGVDSMALAQLCAMLQRYPPGFANYYPPIAFIVDHKARKGSDVEATLVRRRLYRMGLYSTILSLDWPAGVNPLELPDFETQARRLRYQTLGVACSAQNLTRLLFAHHADDQAETVLTRLSSDHKGLGLRGMQTFTNIPECWGIHKVHHSGCYESALDGYNKRLSRTGRPSPLDWLEQRDQKILSSPPLIESGGIRISRPLLNFRKQDLVDTCRAHGVVWSEDPTNQDLWRTPRNAVRHLLGNFRLPMALETKSLLRISSHMEAKEMSHNRLATLLYERCHILLFDLRSGSMVVRLPKQQTTGANVQKAKRGLYKSRQLVASTLVQRLVTGVTPCKDVPLHSLKRAVTAMFPILEHPGDGNVKKKIEHPKFTIGGVLFERISSSLSDVDVKSSLGTSSNGQISGNSDLDPNFIWSLTRQPFASVSADVELDVPANNPNNFLIDETPACKTDALAPTLWSPWHLWDGRYWIRIKNLTNQPLKVRPFKESDLQAIRKSTPSTVRKPFEELLASAAPNKVRWTLPVIAHAVKEGKDTGKVLALPTLGKTGMIDIEDENGQRKLQWEVRYKFVGVNKKAATIISWEDS